MKQLFWSLVSVGLIAFAIPCIASTNANVIQSQNDTGCR